MSSSLASPWRMRARVEAMNSSSEPMRIGSGRTIDVSPASQHAADGGDQRPARRPEHGDVVPWDQTLRLQGGGDGARLVVDLPPRER